MIVNQNSKMDNIYCFRMIYKKRERWIVILEEQWRWAITDGMDLREKKVIAVSLPAIFWNSSSISSLSLDLGIFPINSLVLGSLTFTFNVLPSPSSWESSCEWTETFFLDTKQNHQRRGERIRTGAAAGIRMNLLGHSRLRCRWSYQKSSKRTPC